MKAEPGTASQLRGLYSGGGPDRAELDRQIGVHGAHGTHQLRGRSLAEHLSEHGLF